MAQLAVESSPTVKFMKNALGKLAKEQPPEMSDDDKAMLHQTDMQTLAAEVIEAATDINNRLTQVDEPVSVSFGVPFSQLGEAFFKKDASTIKELRDEHIEGETPEYQQAFDAMILDFAKRAGIEVNLA